MSYQEQFAKDKLSKYYAEAEQYRLVSQRVRQSIAYFLRSLAFRLEAERPSKVGSSLGKPQAS